MKLWLGFSAWSLYPLALSNSPTLCRSSIVFRNSLCWNSVLQLLSTRKNLFCWASIKCQRSFLFFPCAPLPIFINPYLMKYVLFIWMHRIFRVILLDDKCRSLCPCFPLQLEFFLSQNFWPMQIGKKREGEHRGVHRCNVTLLLIWSNGQTFSTESYSPAIEQTFFKKVDAVHNLCMFFLRFLELKPGFW